MSGRLAGVLTLALLFAAPGALAAEKDAPAKKDDSPPPPPPPPPPLEETGPIESPASGEWSIRGQNSLLDTGSGHTRRSMISVFVGIPWYSSYYGPFYSTSLTFNLGGRFYLPLVKEGFLPMLNDSFGVEFGADLFVGLPGFGYGSVGFGMQIPAEVRWNFHLFPKLEVYAKLGAALGVLFTPVVWVTPILIVNVGALFKLNETFYVRAEVGSPALKVGIGFAF